MEELDAEQIASRAKTLRSRLPTTSVIGLGLAHGLDQAATGLSKRIETDWSPFAGASATGAHTVLVLPAARSPVDRTRIGAIRILKALGGETLITAGWGAALRSRFPVGSVVAVADHINLTGTNPLVGPNDERIGPRFPGMTAPYDVRMLECAEQAALETGIRMQRGVFAAVAHHPTPAECRFLAYVGADVYGFGIVPDAITAIHAGLQVLAVVMVNASRIPDGTSAYDAVDAGHGIAQVLARMWASN